MNPENFISLVCLLLTGGIAMVGVLSGRFRDSLLQRIGLSGISIACLLRVPDKFGADYIPPEILLAQISLSIYAVGCVLAVVGRGGENTLHNPTKLKHFN
jgi:hypothetical protein